MDITTENLVRKYNACVDALDESKNCQTCKHYGKESPCNECLETVMFFPVNPTEWEARS